MLQPTNKDEKIIKVIFRVWVNLPKDVSFTGILVMMPKRMKSGTDDPSRLKSDVCRGTRI